MIHSHATYVNALVIHQLIVKTRQNKKKNPPSNQILNLSLQLKLNITMKKTNIII
jgi:hypothetical protein